MSRFTLPLALLIFSSPLLAQGSSASAPLWHADGAASFELLGSGKAGGSYDLNGDGLLDIVTTNFSASTNALTMNGMVQAHSGADGSVLWRRDGLNDGEQYGKLFTAAGDLNGDGVTDFFHREPSSSRNGLIENGLVEAIDGKTGILIWSRLGLSHHENLGSSGKVLPDLDGDGFPEVAFGAPGADSNGLENNGYVEVVRGQNGYPYWHRSGTINHNGLGEVMSIVDDLDGDGVDDMVTSSPSSNTLGFWHNGFAMAISVDAGVEMWRIYGPEDNSLLGEKIKSIPDVNSDGAPDILMVSPNAFASGRYWNGTMRMVSGIDGTTIWNVHGDFHNDRLGDVFNASNDLTGDGLVNIVVGAPNRSTLGKTQNGALLMLDGATSQALWIVEGTDDYASLGSEIIIPADLNGDGLHDIVAATPNANTNNYVGNGAIHSFTGNGGAPIWRIDGTSTSAHLGNALLRVADVNGDGVIDLVSGSEYADSNGLSNNGNISGIDGVSGSILWSVNGETSDTQLGSRLAGVTDLDGDGIKDFVSHANMADTNGLVNNGSARAVSGASGVELWRHDGVGNDDRFGWFVYEVGDLDGDLHTDIILGAPYADANGFADSGYLVAMSGGVTVSLTVEDQAGTTGVTAGQINNWILSGAHSGDKVWMVISTNGAGLTDTGYGFNLLLAAPYTILGNTIANSNGEATLPVSVPGGAAGMTVHTQAVIFAGQGNFRLSRASSFDIL